jgi:hypothetical protein
MRMKIARRLLRMIAEMRMAVADEPQVGPGLQLVEVQDLAAEMIRRYYDLVSANAGLAAECDRLRLVVDALLGVIATRVSADELAHWRSIIGTGA